MILTKNPKLYFIKDTEAVIGRDRQTLRRWWKRKIFPAPTLINKRLVWHVETINEWISKNTQGG